MECNANFVVGGMSGGVQVCEELSESLTEELNLLESAARQRPDIG
jgi:hypothetical protein